jgi:hypothetical protein
MSEDPTHYDATGGRAGTPAERPPNPKVSVGKHFEFLARLIDRATLDLTALSFRTDKTQHLALACLYSTILQSVTECVTLLSKPTITVPAVIRTIVESYADLCALVKDKRHANRMLATFCKEKKRHLTSMLNSPDNVYHKDVATKINATVELRKVMSQLAKLKTRKHLPMLTEHRFQFAGLDDIYRTYYWQLCLEGHNSLRVLEERHIVQTGDRLNLVLVKPNSAEDLWGWIDCLAAFLLDASVKLHKFLRSGAAKEYRKAWKELRSLRVLAYPEEGRSKRANRKAAPARQRRPANRAPR